MRGDRDMVEKGESLVPAPAQAHQATREADPRPALPLKSDASDLMKPASSLHRGEAFKESPWQRKLLHC